MIGPKFAVDSLADFAFRIPALGFIVIFLVFAHDIKVDTWLDVLWTFHGLDGSYQFIYALSEEHVIGVEGLSFCVLAGYFSLTGFSLGELVLGIGGNVGGKGLQPFFGAFGPN